MFLLQLRILSCKSYISLMRLPKYKNWIKNPAKTKVSNKTLIKSPKLNYLKTNKFKQRTSAPKIQNMKYPLNAYWTRISYCMP